MSSNSCLISYYTNVTIVFTGIALHKSTDYPLTVFEEQYREEYVQEHTEVADLSESQKWTELITYLKDHRDLINKCRLPKDESTPPTLYTPLHYAANGNAPKEVFEELLALGASRTLRTADGETAYDIGERMSLDPDILAIIEVPEIIRQKATEIKIMEEGLHLTILGRVEGLVTKNGQQLPQLSYVYEMGDIWYPIPCMYGGFHVRKCPTGIETESFCRIVGGSGQRHRIDITGKVKLVSEGMY